MKPAEQRSDVLVRRHLLLMIAELGGVKIEDLFTNAFQQCPVLGHGLKSPSICSNSEFQEAAEWP